MRHLTWWPLIAWRCSAPWHQRPTDWHIYNKWQPTTITLWCSSVIYQQHHNVMIPACHQPVNGIGVYTAVARWSSWPWPPASLREWHRVLSFARFLRRAAPGWMPEATSCWRDWPFALIFTREMSPSAGAPGAASRKGWFVPKRVPWVNSASSGQRVSACCPRLLASGMLLIIQSSHRLDMAKCGGDWCSAINCTNGRHNSSVSFFRFPKDPARWVFLF